MTRYFPSEALRRTLAELPTPAEYFSGVEGWFREPPRNILVFTRTSPREAMDGGLHLHPRFVFCWCMETGGGIMVDGTMLRLEPGQGLLLFPFQQHYFSSFQKGEKILWAFVSFELESQHLLDPLRSTPVEIDAASVARLEEVLGAFRADLAGDAVAGGAIAAWLMLLLGSLAGRAGSRAQPHSGTMRAPDSRIHRVVRHVYENLDHSLTIAEMAETVHVSPSHLRRLFRREMGISLGRFMLHARLNHALSLLHTSDLPIARIADACGFGSVYSFSRAFRNEKGMAPGAIRR